MRKCKKDTYEKQMERFNAAIYAESTTITFSINTAADIYGCTRAYINQLVREKKLEKIEKNKNKRITAESLKKIIEEKALEKPTEENP